MLFRFVILAVTLVPAFVLAEPGALKGVDFRRDVLPVISSKCFHCHGPDEKARKAKLRLDVREDALLDRDGLRAVVPGDPAKSEMILRITSKDEEEVMPPPKEDKPLTAAEAEILRKWIAQGAEYSQHWAFVKPQVPAVASSPAGAKSRNEVDNFVAAKLTEQGMVQSPEADKLTLLRRVSLDLTGLPPSAEEISVIASEAASVSYENAVERLLASSAYGEKWARMWLDLARYADSRGYGSDQLRMNVWPWREWLIGALNRNVPYDQFSTEMLAGDLLPGATQEQMMATGFHRNTMTNVEGGTDDEEYRVAAVKDRVATTMQVWMGLTAGCAQCHTHKFDPISQKEYYQLFAVFNQTEDADREDESPRMPVKTKGEEEQRAKLNAEIAAFEARGGVTSEAFEAELHQWEAKIAPLADVLPPTKDRDIPANIAATLALEPSEREPQQRAELKEFFRPKSKIFAAAAKEIEDKRAQMAKIKSVELPIMRERTADKRRKTFFLNKGNFLAPGDEVAAAMPVAFAPPPKLAQGEEMNRLALARWIFSTDNPLTARVAVNRFWAQIFGTGIVETEEDFGTQGQFPSHPELLDWLALKFQTPKASGGLGWDVKALLRLIVTSQTYRQSSKVSAVAAQKDVRNRWLSHYPRRRLEAEALRDQALMLSGLLSRKIGGPSVYPPQPGGLWSVAFNDGQNGYPTSKGEDRFRRGLYTFWRRTAPNPTMFTFDAPSRESCTIRRMPTNTPLQALVTLNDPVFVECAQSLARRIVSDAKGDTASRVRWALELCLCRPATDAQVAALRELYDAELANYKGNTAAATQLATNAALPLPQGADAAELAAWTVVTNTLLSLDGVLMKN